MVVKHEDTKTQRYKEIPGQTRTYQFKGLTWNFLSLCLCVLVSSCLLTTFAQTKTHFRVCADPDNFPFSNRRHEGLQNKMARLMANALGEPPSYVWWGQRRGFIRNTMNASLKENRCDVVIGVPKGYDLVRTTKPYYRSTYVFVYP